MPTVKQKNAFKKVLKGTSIRQAMKEAGYSKSTKDTTGKLTRSRGWQELMEKYLPDKDLLKIHKEGLNASNKILVNGKDVGLEQPDFGIRHKYLDTAYKIKKKINNNDQIQQNVIYSVINQIINQDNRPIIQTGRAEIKGSKADI